EGGRPSGLVETKRRSEQSKHGCVRSASRDAGDDRRIDVELLEELAALTVHLLDPAAVLSHTARPLVEVDRVEDLAADGLDQASVLGSVDVDHFVAEVGVSLPDDR